MEAAGNTNLLKSPSEVHIASISEPFLAVNITDLQEWTMKWLKSAHGSGRYMKIKKACFQKEYE